MHFSAHISFHTLSVGDKSGMNSDMCALPCPRCFVNSSCPELLSCQIVRLHIFQISTSISICRLKICYVFLMYISYFVVYACPCYTAIFVCGPGRPVTNINTGLTSDANFQELALCKPCTFPFIFHILCY